MKIALSTNQFFDDEGRPLVNGRVSVHLHASDVLVDVYTLSGHGYVQAENPFITADDGRIPSLFFDATVVDVWVEKQVGDGIFELLDTYQDGFEMPSVKNDTVVYGVSALQDVNPSVGAVSVVGYDDDVDAPQRTYIWVPDCSEPADSGVVVDSNSGQSGRWVLLWECDTLPSSVYGIVPGTNEANIAAFLDYPDQIGNVVLPQVRRFEKGTYTSNTTFACTRQVMFDTGAKFLYASFEIPSAIINQCSGYVADFTFSSTDAVAHSCWFRTVTGFWFCGAGTYVIDETNNFADTVLAGKPTLTRKVITGSKRIPMTYSNNNYITIERCTLNATEIFSPVSDYIRFVAMPWLDCIWNDTTVSHFDFGKVSDGHHIEFLASALNRQQLSQFRSTGIYVRMREAEIAANPAASKVLDLEGRSLPSFSSSSFTKLMDCHVTGNVTLTSAPSGFTMQDVVVDGQVDGGTNLVFINVTASLNSEWTGSLAAYDSTLSGAKVTGVHDISVVGGRWRKPIQNATDNTVDTGTILFRGVELDGLNVVHKTKNLNLIDCGVYEQQIEVYPYLDTSTNTFRFNGRIENCEINNSTHPIAYKIFHDLVDGCQDCVLSYSWISNSWFGNSYGMTMEFWADPLALKNVIATSGHFVVYSGNVGLCPLEAWHGQASNVSWSQCAFYPEGGDIDSPLTNFYRANISMRCMPNLNNANVVHNTTYGAWIAPAYQVSGGATTKGYLAATNPAPPQYGYGDLFDACLVKYGSAGDSSVVYV